MGNLCLIPDLGGKTANMSLLKMLAVDWSYMKTMLLTSLLPLHPYVNISIGQIPKSETARSRNTNIFQWALPNDPRKKL